jgi:hypothetical protein
MILSEFAGAAQSLNGSLLINPCMFPAAVDFDHRKPWDGTLMRDHRGCPKHGRCYSFGFDYGRRAEKIELGEIICGESSFLHGSE